MAEADTRARDTDERRQRWASEAARRRPTEPAAWHGAEVHAVVDPAQPERSDALARWAAAWGARGETLGALAQDVEALRAAAPGHADLAPSEVFALVAAWAAAYYDRSDRSRCVEPLTGLATAEYLALRATELRRQCEAFGIDPAAAWSVLRVEVATADDPMTRIGHRLRVATELRSAFDAGETIASVDVSTVVVVVPAGWATAEALQALRDRLGAAAASVRQLPFEPPYLRSDLRTGDRVRAAATVRSDATVTDTPG